MRDKLYEMSLRAYNVFDTAKWRIKSYLKDQRGATAVEYALVIAVVVTMVIAAAGFMYDPLKVFFIGVITKITGIATKKSP